MGDATRPSSRWARRRVIRTAATAVAASLVALLGSACLPGRTYTYRIATRGPVVADVGEFAARVDRTLQDPRGWSLGGAIRFVRTDGPADATIWLATAATVPSFGPPCSPQWSCRSGANVIVNEDRWLGATALWPYGLDAYRDYVVVHEVGHWLGLPHASCPGFGERAPVMVQQSKGGAVLGPCRFNVWPTPGERQAVASIHGVDAPAPDLPSPDDPFGAVDVLAVRRDDAGRPVEVRAAGWAADGDTAGPLRVLVLVDGAPAADLTGDGDRPDVAAAFPRIGPAHGFDTTAPVPAEGRVACVVAVGQGAGLPWQQLGCAVVK